MMKKFWSIIFAVLLCNIISLSVSTDGEREYLSYQSNCFICQQGTTSYFDCASDFTRLEQPEFVAVIVNTTNATEAQWGEKNSASNGGKVSQNNQRKYLGNSLFISLARSLSVVDFSRAIDRYVYAFRHIII